MSAVSLRPFLLHLFYPQIYYITLEKTISIKSFDDKFKGGRIFVVDILKSIVDFVVNNPLATAVAGALSAAFGWKLIGWVWENLKPIQKGTEFAKKWAEEKGRSFAVFYAKRIPNADFRNKTKKEIADASNEIQEAFVKGLLSVN